MRIIPLLLAGLIAAVPAFAGPAATLDLASRSDPEPHYLVFCGRNNSLTGHAFVVWGREDAAHRMSVQDGAFGLYPRPGNGVTGTVQMMFASVPGEIAQESITRSLTADLIRLVVRVDRATYQEAVQVKAEWAARGGYQLLEQDCISFTSQVAARVGLSLPVRATLDRPWTYIANLIAANPQSAFYSGEWASIDPASRFTLSIKGENCDWTERSPGGATLTRRAGLERDVGQATVKRVNDDAVLALLGFQPSLRSEILARNPPPSYLVLRRTGESELRATWCGLIAIKDNQARLIELIPPGARPGVEFVFRRR